MIINAENSIVGRVATVAAKKALMGEEVNIVNCEKAVISGSKERIMDEFKRKISMGIHSKGPIHYRVPFRLVKRVVRGMLPHKQSKGREALKRIKCYNDIPEVFEGKTEVLKEASVAKLKNYKYMSVGEICRLLKGGV